MRFLLDANIPYSSKKVFEKYGEAIHVRDVKLAAAPDQEIHQSAIKRKAILVTRDLDFGNPYLYPKHFGLIILRVPSYFKTPEINRVFETFLASLKIRDLKNAITVVEPGRIRVRKAG